MAERDNRDSMSQEAGPRVMTMKKAEELRQARAQEARERKARAVGSELALKRKANALRRSMLDSLAARKLTEEIYYDMVTDYLELWWHRAALEADIRENGVKIFDAKRGIDVENCAVSARVRVSAQMAKLYKALGCQELAQKNQVPDGEDDDL